MLWLRIGESILLFCDNVQMEFAGQDGPEFKGRFFDVVFSLLVPTSTPIRINLPSAGERNYFPPKIGCVIHILSPCTCWYFYVFSFYLSMVRYRYRTYYDSNLSVVMGYVRNGFGT